MNHRTSVLPQRQSPITPLLEHAPSAAAFCGSAAIFHPLSAPAVLAQRPGNGEADKIYSADGRAEKTIGGRYAARHAAYGNAGTCKRRRFRIGRIYSENP